MAKVFFEKRKKRLKVLKDSGMSFSSKVVPREGVIAIFLGIFSILFFLGLAIFSTIQRGEGGRGMGALGMGAFLLALIGFVLSLRTIRRDNIIVKIPMYGVIINMIAVILYLILYFYGIIIMML